MVCWNGEVFGGAVTPREGESDTAAVVDSVLFALASDDPHAQLTRCLSGLLGPYAICVAVGGALYFARDPVGRRSMLLETPASCGNPVVVSSVASVFLPNNSSQLELAPCGVYCLQLVPRPAHEVDAASRVTWSLPSCRAGWTWVISCMAWPQDAPFRAGLAEMPSVPSGPLRTATADGHAAITAAAEPGQDERDAEWASDSDVAVAALELIRCLGEAVRLRVQDVPVDAASSCRACCGAPSTAVLVTSEPSVSAVLQRVWDAVPSSLADGTLGRCTLPSSALTCSAASPALACNGLQCGCIARVAIPFSGGLDSMILARLAHEFVPPTEAIDLINVCFAADHLSPDRLAAAAGLQVGN